jgi:acetyltransferase
MTTWGDGYHLLVRHEQVLDPREVPAIYPRELEAVAVLDHGQKVWIRPMAPCDRKGLSWEIQNADNETLYLRFFSRAVRGRPEFVDTLLDLDYQERLALVAIGEGGEGAGVARYVVTDEPDLAQLAIVVKEGWRRVGLATVLLQHIQRAAWQRNIRRMTAIYLAENAAIDGLRCSTGLPEPVVRRGLAEINWNFTEDGEIAPESTHAEP